MCPFPVLQSDLYELSQPGIRCYKFNISVTKIGLGVYVFDIKDSASMEKLILWLEQEYICVTDRHNL